MLSWLTHKLINLQTINEPAHFITLLSVLGIIMHLIFFLPKWWKYWFIVLFCLIISKA